MAISYREAGVDIDAGDELVERIKPFAKATRIPEVLADVGGFAGLCAVPGGIEEPVLVSGTDGVGTKLKVAFLTGVHDTIGFDLVGMCVNDIVTCGARPLFFLDYFGTGKLELGVAESVIKGIAAACQESGCALLGGETAELPGMYAAGEYDLAGFAVGVVARKKIVDGKRVAAGDRVIGVASSGLHSNGYSLARRVLFDAMKLTPADRPEKLGGKTVAEALLAPTRLYARHVRAVQEAGVDIRAMSHITGGGLPGNLPRVLPEGLGVRLPDTAWARPAILELIAERVEEAELRRVFNLGVGFVFVVPAADADKAISAIGEPTIDLGEIVALPADTDFEARVVFPQGDRRS
ncbi:MAG: phosphoribosylformylglycinamidine cyclo-ligase [Labilithrix sp.]